MKIRKYLLFTGILMSLFGCRQAGSGVDQSASGNDSAQLAESFQSELTDIYHRFPSPDEMMNLLDQSQIKYKTGLTNNTANVPNYLNSRSQALNIGVYSADLAYISVFKRFNESSVYFESIYKLCDNLQIASAFDYSMLKRIQNNISEPDSLKSISNLAFSRLNSYLVENRQEKTFAIISMGGFVEALYISFGLCNSFSENNILVQNIADQKYVIDNIVTFSKNFGDNADIKNTLELMKPIISVYDSLKVVPQETKVTKTSDGKLVINGGNKLEITEVQYNQLKSASFEVRNQIIKN
jgi:hypothetical protein